MCCAHVPALRHLDGRGGRGAALGPARVARARRADRVELLQLVRVTHAAGQGARFHRHPALEELLYVLDGPRRAVGRPREARPRPRRGRARAADEVHGTYNVFDAPVVFLAILSPAVFDGPALIDVSQRRALALAATGPLVPRTHPPTGSPHDEDRACQRPHRPREALAVLGELPALAAAGFGFAFRVAMGGKYGAELGLTEQQVGEVFGASLWPIAITMIGFSLVVDRTGYKAPMYGAFALQTFSGVGTLFASNYAELYLFALCAGLGHGIVEAVINPICAAVYPKEKTNGYLPARRLAGGARGRDAPDSWAWIRCRRAASRGACTRPGSCCRASPTALMYLPCKFPVDGACRPACPTARCCSRWAL